ncbi:MAG TPA: hypothetical protein VHX38_24355 [Pseudonocardiaceae bacterium]|jgi:hypothetical protein|nr:hypothetical protein [Pseudonocardiaceae bacterium]
MRELDPSRSPRSDPRVGSLPPRPDPGTGLPRPPHAPGFAGDPRAKAADWETVGRLTKVPGPPPDCGRPLVWYRVSWRTTLRTAAVVVIVLALVTGIVSLTRTGDLAVFTLVPAGLGIVITALQAALPVRRDRCAVGADWLSYRGAWVKTYELAEITTRTDGDGSHGGSGGVLLSLTDTDGRTIETGFASLQQDRRVWDYLYNGIRHSVASGAQLRGSAQQYFLVGLPPRANTAGRREADPA